MKQKPMNFNFSKNKNGKTLLIGIGFLAIVIGLTMLMVGCNTKKEPKFVKEKGTRWVVASMDTTKFIFLGKADYETFQTFVAIDSSKKEGKWVTDTIFLLHTRDTIRDAYGKPELDSLKHPIIGEVIQRALPKYVQFIDIPRK